MRTIILICLVLFTAACQKDATCHCEELQNGVTVKEYDAVEYKYKGSYNADDKCLLYEKENRASKVAGKQDYVFQCHGQYK